MASYSPFTITSKQVELMLGECQQNVQFDKQCFMIQVQLQNVYGDKDTLMPNGVYKKLPRLLNGIPLGAGTMSPRDSSDGIRWRYLEASGETQTFISVPMTRDEADENYRSFKDSLVLNSKSVFGDITVKCTITLTQCMHFVSDMYINDIAYPNMDGLHFQD